MANTKKHILKISHFKIHPIIGIGYWKDVYNGKNHGYIGVSHNFILPFCRIQIGHLQFDPEQIQ